MAKRGLYANINARKKAGTSRSKKNSTISSKAYANMKAGFPKKGKKKKWKDYHQNKKNWLVCQNPKIKLPELI